MEVLQKGKRWVQIIHREEVRKLFLSPFDSLPFLPHSMNLMEKDHFLTLKMDYTHFVTLLFSIELVSRT